MSFRRDTSGGIANSTSALAGPKLCDAAPGLAVIEQICRKIHLGDDSSVWSYKATNQYVGGLAQACVNKKEVL